jgi:ribosomal protein L14E/L6E/L27E
MLQLGQVVVSKAGRDQGRFMMIVGFAEDNTLLLADGSLRKLETPKRKNIKHVAKTNTVFEEIASQLSNPPDIANAAIKTYLSRYDNQNKESDIH